jgi:hypothetical protein
MGIFGGVQHFYSKLIIPKFSKNDINNDIMI